VLFRSNFAQEIQEIEEMIKDLSERNALLLNFLENKKRQMKQEIVKMFKYRESFKGYNLRDLKK